LASEVFLKEMIIIYIGTEREKNINIVLNGVVIKKTSKAKQDGNYHNTTNDELKAHYL
jgi:hypothetical protein